MNIIIIDDENKARRVLEQVLIDACPTIDTIYHASNLQEGVGIIKTEKVDIVFLDIEMPEHSGLEIFDLLGNVPVDFQLIFVTAYNKYAVDAFKLSATDYVLKPISITDVKSAVDKALHNIKSQQKNYNAEMLKRLFKQLSVNKIALEIPRGITFVSYDDIYFFEADGMYTKVHFENKKHELICKPLRYFEEQLVDKSFFYRPHRS
ncbi:MAG: LytTR family DNA-binding domain-containing protein, partial [Bacteroidota bacterium]